MLMLSPDSITKLQARPRPGLARRRQPATTRRQISLARAVEALTTPGKLRAPAAELYRRNADARMQGPQHLRVRLAADRRLSDRMRLELPASGIRRGSPALSLVLSAFAMDMSSALARSVADQADPARLGMPGSCAAPDGILHAHHTTHSGSRALPLRRDVPLLVAFKFANQTCSRLQPGLPQNSSGLSSRSVPTHIA